MAILQIIDQLDALLENSRRMPMSSLRMVEYKEFKQLIDRLRVNVPSAIVEGERTLRERDRILRDAESEATHMAEQTQQRVRELLDNDTLVMAARREAERIVDNAQETARLRRDEADRYAMRVLQELAEKLGVIGKQVDNGIDLLRQNLELEPPPPTGAAKSNAAQSAKSAAAKKAAPTTG